MRPGVVPNPVTGSDRPVGPPSGRRPGRLRPTAAVLALAATLLGGCGSDTPTPAPTPGSASPSVAPTAVSDARTRLAGLAAAAGDRRYTALYNLASPGRAGRTVVATIAADGSWRVDIPGGALGGTADVAVARTTAGLFQCGLPSAERPVEGTCVRVADPDGRLPARVDPRVQHAFTDWIELLTDRRAPLSVSAAAALPDSRGSCFTVDSTTASLSAPLAVGIYCLADDGLLTAAKVDFGTLTLAGDPGPAPPAIALPGRVVAGPPLGMASPPPPPTPSPAPPGQPGPSQPAG